jgi:hypothetical protein
MKKGKICWFSSEKLFWLSKIAKFAVVNREAALCTCTKEYNKYDLTAAQCFCLAFNNDWPSWFTISSSTPISYPIFSFMSGVAKN